MCGVGGNISIQLPHPPSPKHLNAEMDDDFHELICWGHPELGFFWLGVIAISWNTDSQLTGAPMTETITPCSSFEGLLECAFQDQAHQFSLSRFISTLLISILYSAISTNPEFNVVSPITGMKNCSIYLALAWSPPFSIFHQSRLLHA